MVSGDHASHGQFRRGEAEVKEFHPVLPSLLPSFEGVTLFRHFAPGPRPRHSIRPADFKSRNKSTCGDWRV